VALSQVTFRLRDKANLRDSYADAATLLAALIERVELRPDGMRLWFRVAIPLVGAVSARI